MPGCRAAASSAGSKGVEVAGADWSQRSLVGSGNGDTGGVVGSRQR